AVAISGHEAVFDLVERFEIFRPRDTDRRPVISVAPRDPPAVFDPDDARIVGVLEMRDFGIALHLNALWIDLPVDAIVGEADVDLDVGRRGGAAEHAGEFSVEGHDSAVEDAVGAGKEIARDDGILAVPPDDVWIPRRLILPRDIRQRIAVENGRGL